MSTARTYVVVVGVAEDGALSLLPIEEATGTTVDLEDGLVSLVTSLSSWEVPDGLSIADRLRGVFEQANRPARAVARRRS